MNNFIFSYPTKVYFGKGCVKEYLASLLRGYGPTVMLAYGGGSLKKSGVYDQMISILAEAGKTVVEFGGIMPNPTYAKVQEGAKLVKEHHVDFILAVGGGSVIDCSKIVSAQAMTDSDIWELENVKREYPTKFIPMGAVVTASGTGSEMNNGAVITHEEKKIKGGMVGAHNDFAMLDPMYTMTVPFRQVISGAFDTISHAMETYFGKPQENNLSDDISEAVMRSVIANIRVLLTDPENYNARSELMWASAMAENGILKIGKVTDFQCHQMEHQLGAYTDCNHGAGLAVLHPAYYRHIYKDGLAKFKRFAVRVWGIDPTGKSDEEVAAAGVEALADFIKEIGLPTTLRELGVDESIDLGIIAASCNVAPGSYGKMCHAEIAAIFSECR
jgi:alcohol dehydrogenase YqhD (iron-dependent ADH family)